MTLEEVKSALVSSHRIGDWEEAKRLSQIKQKIKRKKHCSVCGVRISHGDSNSPRVTCALHKPTTLAMKMKRWVSLAALFIIAIRANAGCLISTNTSPWVPASATPMSWTVTGSFSGGTGGRTFSCQVASDIQKSGTERIRLSGTVYAVGLIVNSAGSTHSGKFKVFRFHSLTSTNILDLIGESETVTLATGSNYFVLAQPITGVQEGDIKGMFIAGGATATTIGIGAGATETFASGDVTGTSQTIASAIGGQVKIEFYMGAPVIGYVGDSIIAGHNTGKTTYWRPFLDTNFGLGKVSGVIQSSIPYCASTNGESLVNYCNYGKGSQTLFWVLTNGMPAMLGDGVRVGWVHCLINDITAGFSWSTISNNLEQIWTIWPQTNILFFGECLPDNAVNTVIASTIRQYNTNLASWATTKSNVTVALMHDAFATNNVNNGNLLDYMSDAYAQNSDAPHLNQNGVSNYVWIMNGYLKNVIVTPP